ncbi:MAG: phosphoglycerate dehydrogenase [Deltaproteobacteria bacterium]|nr:phosphoglycerate dehydrogenase [Deltaproteobacteria bacterium]
MTKKVLISDKLSEAGLEILEKAQGIQTDSKPGLSPEELKAIIGEYDALVIRSGTTVTADILEAATRLKLVGRAGIGVDNVDVASASKHGVIVENTPSGNAVTTAEHALAMLFAVSRMIPQATMSMKAGKWEKKQFMGRELCNKVLGVVGVGNIGKIVANRALGLKMRVLGFDPFLTPEAASKMGIELVSLEEIFKQSDYITTHVPLNDKTRGLINADSFAKMKDGVFIINCARGGIVDEEALLQALNSGKVAGAGLDVFVKEPPEANSPLVQHPKVVCTPHLGASTDEAQVNVAVEVAQQVVDYLQRGEIRNAINFPSLSGELAKVLKPYSKLAEALGKLLGHYAEGTPKEIHLEFAGEIKEYPLGSLTAAALKGFLQTHLSEEGQVNYVNAPFLAKERGISVKEIKVSEAKGYTNLLQFKVLSDQGEHRVSGTVFGTEHPRLIRLDDFYLEAEPKGCLLMVKNQDKPGVIGKIGTTLGERNINISRMHLGLNAKAGEALAVYSLDSEPNQDLICALESLEHVLWVKVVLL